ncbi:hypothetical protein D3C80_1955660 [compost metagenome]
MLAKVQAIAAFDGLDIQLQITGQAFHYPLAHLVVGLAAPAAAGGQLVVAQLLQIVRQG